MAKKKKNNIMNRVHNAFKALFGQSKEVNVGYLSSASDIFGTAPEMYESIFGVVSRLSNTLASLPLHLYDADYNEPTDCSGYNLIKDGFRYFNRFDFIRDCEALRNLDGNAYVHLIRDVNGNVVDLKLVKPSACSLNFDMTSGTLYYSISAEDDNKVVSTLFIPYSDILHFKHIAYGSPVGISPIHLLSDTLNYDQKIRQISLSQLQGTNEGFIVKMDQSHLSDSEAKEQVKNIAQFYKENGGVLLQQAGMEIERIERSLVDTKLLDVDQITRSRVAMVFGVPLHFLGVNDTSYNSMEQLNTEFVTGNLMSTVTQFEEELNRKLLTPRQRAQGYHFEFDMRGLLRGDVQTRTAFYQAAIRCGVLTPNEIRESEGYTISHNPNADRLWISGDLYPIDEPISNRKGGGSNSNGNQAK